MTARYVVTDDSNDEVIPRGQKYWEVELTFENPNTMRHCYHYRALSMVHHMLDTMPPNVVRVELRLRTV